MEACPAMKYELVVQIKEGHHFSYNVPKKPKVEKKIYFWYSKVQVSKRTQQKTSNFWAFLRQTGLWEPNPQKYVQIFLQILNPANDAEILAPELVDGQSEMVVSQFCHTFFILTWW